MFSVDITPKYVFSMDDPTHPFSRLAVKPFELEGQQWPSVEHYFQAMQLASASERDRVRQLAAPEDARRAGKGWFKKRRKDWRQLRPTLMTRALYIQMRTYPERAKALLETGDLLLVEDSQYDYFWGCGRDKRGTNTYGKILMEIRRKLADIDASPETE
ncbi:NADAR family protein [Gilvimarinus algae]|uniref:NADAR family protein n=1 Tax=Gilvimarinus algae TaxID=3058037 RepID=A0ABT8TKH8_9GAMM|nr:NADAR family protein [Gilvimarinus sp. SDUM040014]MDO3384100.1 NADAR family protein [Gilvimarinus sp. SDUM040014]